MKYLVILAVVLIAVWVWRSTRPRADRRDEKPAAPPTLDSPQDMVRCPVCSVHLPRTDALAGPDGRMYCCADHRHRAGD